MTLRTHVNDGTCKLLFFQLIDRVTFAKTYMKYLARENKNYEGHSTIKEINRCRRKMAGRRTTTVSKLYATIPVMNSDQQFD